MELTRSDYSHPILSCADAADWEESLLKSSDDAWDAMNRVGEQLASAICSDISMTGFSRSGWRALGLIGKGHNGGDALLALHALQERERLDAVTVIVSGPVEELKPNTKRAFDMLRKKARLQVIARGDDDESWLEAAESCLASERFDLCVDGLLGMQFRPPLRDYAAELLKRVNASQAIGFRVAVDLPSGVGSESDEHAFRADVTYATGIFKRPLLASRRVGVARYLDIGFFRRDRESAFRVLTDRILDPLRSWRPAESEKRVFGHLAVLAGSRAMPGALAMSVKAALRSGAGLVTALAPESIVAQLAPVLPEAMWRPWPETPEGGLALEGLWQIKALAERADALLMGPGMGREKETLELMREVGSFWDRPVALDADALQPEVVEAFRGAGNQSVVATPHDGEFKRLSGGSEATDDAVRRYAEEAGVTVVKKGSGTRVSDGEKVFLVTTGNAVLARGGSGDLLAGITAGQLAGDPEHPLEVACRSAYWHGKAADAWAMERGQWAVRSTELLDFLSVALQSGPVWKSDSPASRPTGS